MKKIKKLAAVILGLILIFSIFAIFVFGVEDSPEPEPEFCTGTDNDAIRGDCPVPEDGEEWEACCLDDGSGCGADFGDGCIADEDNGGGDDFYYVKLPGDGRCIDGTFNYDATNCPEMHATCQVVGGIPTCKDDSLVADTHNGDECCAHIDCFSYGCGGSTVGLIACDGNCNSLYPCSCGTSYTEDDYHVSKYIDGYCPLDSCFDETTCSDEKGEADGVCMPGLFCASHRILLGIPPVSTIVASCDAPSSTEEHCIAAEGEWIGSECVFTGLCPYGEDSSCFDEITCPNGESCAEELICDDSTGDAICAEAAEVPDLPPEVPELEGCEIEYVVWLDGEYEEATDGRAGAPVIMALGSAVGQDCNGVSATFIVYNYAEPPNDIRGTEDDTMEVTFEYDADNDMYYALGEWTPLSEDVPENPTVFYFRGLLEKEGLMRYTDRSDDIDIEACEIFLDCSGVCDEEWLEAGYELNQDNDCDGICDCIDQWAYYSPDVDEDGVPDSLQNCFSGGIEASCSSVEWGDCERSDVTGRYKRKRVLRACEYDGETGCCEINVGEGFEECEAEIPSVYGSGIQTKACLPDEVKEFPVFSWVNMLLVSIMVIGYYFLRKSKQSAL